MKQKHGSRGGWRGISGPQFQYLTFYTSAGGAIFVRWLPSQVLRRLHNPVIITLDPPDS